MKTITTSDYSLFKHLGRNREISDKHVKRMMSSLMVNNLMPTNPVLVTPNMEIIDGQHRVKAAEILKLPVTYAIDDNYDPRDLMARQTGKTWSIADRVHFHAAEEAQWDQLQRLHNDTGTPYRTILALIGYTGIACTRKLQEGGFLCNFETWEKIVTRVSQIGALQRWITEETPMREQRFYRHWKFAKALSEILDDGEAWDKVEHKIKLNWKDLRKEKSVESYVSQLKDIVGKRDRKR